MNSVLLIGFIPPILFLHFYCKKALQTSLWSYLWWLIRSHKIAAFFTTIFLVFVVFCCGYWISQSIINIFGEKYDAISIGMQHHTTLGISVPQKIYMIHKNGRPEKVAGDIVGYPIYSFREVYKPARVSWADGQYQDTRTLMTASVLIILGPILFIFFSIALVAMIEDYARENKIQIILDKMAETDWTVNPTFKHLYSSLFAMIWDGKWISLLVLTCLAIDIYYRPMPDIEDNVFSGTLLPDFIKSGEHISGKLIFRGKYTETSSKINKDDSISSTATDYYYGVIRFQEGFQYPVQLGFPIKGKHLTNFDTTYKPGDIIEGQLTDTLVFEPLILQE